MFNVHRNLRQECEPAIDIASLELCVKESLGRRLSKTHIGGVSKRLFSFELSD